MRNAHHRLKRYRESKNYTQEYMGNKLGMTQNSYSRLENGQTKITLERLQEISKVLEEPIENFLSDDKQTFNFNNSHIEKFNGYIETLHEDNKETYTTLIASLKEEIQFLREELKKRK